MALVVFAFGSVSLVWAIMTAVPSPCAARAAISSQSVGATEQRGSHEQANPGQQPLAADVDD